MTSIIFFLALALMLWRLGDARSSQVSYPPRRLHQETVNAIVAKIRVADFASVARASGDALLSERELAGRVNVTSSDEPVLYGAYYLGPGQVAQINHTIATELVCYLRLPAPYMRLRAAVPFLLLTGHCKHTSDCHSFAKLSA
jgi:hypothetical protein